MTADPAPAQVPATARSVGLDAARSLAIGAVLLCHGLLILHAALFPLSPPQITAGVLLGYYGVELFFVLSGFLIGAILFTEVVPNPCLHSIGRFFLRRWLRILPAYYAVLLLLTVLEPGSSVVPRWDYLLLLQNYDRGTEAFFPVSWSLTIEHWSYLAAPLILLALPRLFRRWAAEPWQRIALSLLLVCVLSVLARLATGLWTEASWDAGIRKQIHLRLDAVVFGLLIAGCRHWSPCLFRRLASLPVMLAVAAGLAILVYAQAATMLAAHTPAGADTSLVFKSLGFTLTDLLLALTLPFFASHGLFHGLPQRAPRLHLWCTRGSRYAYSLYLVHFTVFAAAGPLLANIAPLAPLPRVLILVLGGGLALTLSCLAALLLYHGIEKPGMDARSFLPLARNQRPLPASPAPKGSPRPPSGQGLSGPPGDI